MSDDIKSMIKSRRDQRYYGSSFEKRSQYTDETRMDAIQHHMDTATDDTPPDEISSMIGDYNRAQRDSDLNSGRSVEDPNPGSKPQPTPSEIQMKARSYADSLELTPETSMLSDRDIQNHRQGLLDRGYTEEDLRKFKDMYDAIYGDKYDAWSDADDNAKRIKNTRWGRDQ